AYDADGEALAERTFFSVGGGFVVEPDENGAARIVADTTAQQYPFTTGAGLLGHCQRENLRISDVMLANEMAWRSEAEIRAGLLKIWSVMKSCIRKSCAREGTLSPWSARVCRSWYRLSERTRASRWEWRSVSLGTHG